MATGLTGDVVLTCDVTYFVRDIVPFIEKMNGAARRRVIVLVWSEPPPNRGADLFRRVYGEPLAPMPGHRELLPVLWDMGILPDVHVLPDPTWWESWQYATRDRGAGIGDLRPLVPGGRTGHARGASSMNSSTSCLRRTGTATTPFGASRCGNC